MYGHVKRYDDDNVGRKAVKMQLVAKKKKMGRPERRYLGVVTEDIQEVGAMETEVFDRSVWRIRYRPLSRKRHCDRE